MIAKLFVTKHCDVDLGVLLLHST